jgi:hypothetical protein
MKTIPLTQGKVAIVSNKDYKRMMEYKWCAAFDSNGNWRAVRHSSMKDGKRKTIYMHREIKNAPDGMQVDHRNHGTLDNRRSNLRICTGSQNLQNKRVQSNNISGVAGVCWCKRNKKWVAQIRIDKRRKHLGYYDDLKCAIVARYAAERKYFGKFRYNSKKDVANAA